jgi:hypothetical protein
VRITDVTHFFSTTEGEIDLRGFFGLDPTIAAGYRELLTRIVTRVMAQKSSSGRYTSEFWPPHQISTISPALFK